VRLIVVVGARPNVVKVGPLLPELKRAGIEFDLAYTGSRSSARPDDEHPGTMSFYGIQIQAPRWFLDVGTGTEAVTTGRAMVAFEELFAAETPDAVLVVGDVNPTLAAAVSAAKAGLPVVHLEAGLRCGDLGVTEEINRVLISQVAALHLAPTEAAITNLENEGIAAERVAFVGNIMAESVLRQLEAISTWDGAGAWDLPRRGYIVGSFHRPENLAFPDRLAGILGGLAQTSLPTLIPDTGGLRDAIAFGGLDVPPNVRMTDAVDYRAMLALQRDAAVVVTDSGGVQEEACMVGTPCVTVRRETEHPVTVEAGANRLADAREDAVAEAIDQAILAGRRWVIPKRWDNAVSDRIVRALKRGVTPLA